MAKTKVSDYVNRVMEHVIKQTKLAHFDSQKKVIDFKLDDVVKCSYIPGLFTVVDFYPREIMISPLDHTGNCELVSPGFLEKQNVNKDTVKVLYD